MKVQVFTNLDVSKIYNPLSSSSLSLTRKGKRRNYVSKIKYKFTRSRILFSLGAGCSHNFIWKAQYWPNAGLRGWGDTNLNDISDMDGHIKLSFKKNIFQNSYIYETTGLKLLGVGTTIVDIQIYNVHCFFLSCLNVRLFTSAYCLIFFFTNEQIIRRKK